MLEQQNEAGCCKMNTQQSCTSDAYGARSAAASATAARSEAAAPGSTGGVTTSLPGEGSILTPPSCKMGGTPAAAGRVAHVGDTFISTGVNARCDGMPGLPDGPMEMSLGLQPAPGTSQPSWQPQPCAVHVRAHNCGAGRIERLGKQPAECTHPTEMRVGPTPAPVAPTATPVGATLMSVGATTAPAAQHGLLRSAHCMDRCTRSPGMHARKRVRICKHADMLASVSKSACLQMRWAARL